MTVNNIPITPSTIVATREHFANGCRACIAEVMSGKVRVNNIDTYVARQHQRIQSLLAGESDHTLTFMQRALWLQTGEMVAILP